MLSSQFKKKTKRPILSSTVQSFAQSRSISTTSDSKQNQPIKSKNKNEISVQVKHKTNSDQQISENNDGYFSFNFFIPSNKTQEEDSSEFAFNFDISNETSIQSNSALKSKIKKQKSKRKKVKRRLKSNDNIEEENRKNIPLNEEDANCNDIHLGRRRELFKSTLTVDHYTDNLSEQNKITSTPDNEYMREDKGSKESSHSNIWGRGYRTVSLKCTNTTLAPPPGFNDIKSVDNSFHIDQVLKKDEFCQKNSEQRIKMIQSSSMIQPDNRNSIKSQQNQDQQIRKFESDERSFHFNAANKGKAYVNRSSFVVRKEKYRHPRTPIFSENRTIQSSTTDVSPNAFSFGFDFGDILNKKREKF